jgi:hypothetical protein
VTLPLALAVGMALQGSDRSGWRSGLAVAFSTFKPTYGGPLGLLLACRRDVRGGIGGLALGGVLGCLGLAGLFAVSGDLSAGRAYAVLAGNQSQFAEHPDVDPMRNKGRLDLAASVEYLAGRRLPPGCGAMIGAAILAIGGLAVWRLSADKESQSAAGVASTLVVLTMILSIFHNIYDGLALALPGIAAGWSSHASWRMFSARGRIALLALLIVPLVNVLWSDTLEHVLHQQGIAWGSSASGLTAATWRLICAANGLCLFAAWVTLVIKAFTRPTRVLQA